MDNLPFEKLKKTIQKRIAEIKKKGIIKKAIDFVCEFGDNKIYQEGFHSDEQEGWSFRGKVSEHALEIVYKASKTEIYGKELVVYVNGGFVLRASSPSNDDYQIKIRKICILEQGKDGRYPTLCIREYRPGNWAKLLDCRKMRARMKKAEAAKKKESPPIKMANDHEMELGISLGIIDPIKTPQ